jgi:hypothetical protein
MKEIKYMQPMSIAKIAGIAGLVMGLILDIVVIIAGLIQGTSLAELFSNPTLMITPIIGYGIAWFLAGLFFAWLYNLLAKKIGGIKLELN